MFLILYLRKLTPLEITLDMKFRKQQSVAKSEFEIKSLSFIYYTQALPIIKQINVVLYII